MAFIILSSILMLAAVAGVIILGQGTLWDVDKDDAVAKA